MQSKHLQPLTVSFLTNACCMLSVQFRGCPFLIPEQSMRGFDDMGMAGPHVLIKLTQPMKWQKMVDVHEWSISRNVSIFFYQGLRPHGVSQWLSQLVSLMAHSHLNSLTVKALSLRWHGVKKPEVSLPWYGHGSNIINLDIRGGQHQDSKKYLRFFAYLHIN